MNTELLAAFNQLKNHLNEQILGQADLSQRLLIALLADGHLLVEGAPGLAKTRAIKALADGIEGDFHRVQFTPDLLPADLTGTDIYRPQDGSFIFQQGPLFHNLILADEINRAPAKVQAALLEAMAERQITIGSKTYTLPPLFLVMATQNPIEQEGTYPLPEAQLDRFLMLVKIDYPALEVERQILTLAREEARNLTQAQQGKPVDASAVVSEKLSQAQLFSAREDVLNIHLEASLEEYIVQILGATRYPSAYDPSLEGLIQYGASPRASIALERCARARAWLNGQDYVSPDDIQSIAHDVLRHRILLSFEAEADGMDTDQLIDKLLQVVPVP